MSITCACWTDPPASREPIAPRPVRVAPRVRAQQSVWIGQYTCPQGPTALELTIETRGDATTAVFAFGPLDSNPTVPNGAYRMTGTKLDANGIVPYRLEPDAWIDRPDRYEMVGLVARVDGTMLRGEILHPNCGALEARLSR